MITVIRLEVKEKNTDNKRCENLTFNHAWIAHPESIHILGKAQMTVAMFLYKNSGNIEVLSSEYLNYITKEWVKFDHTGFK